MEAPLQDLYHRPGFLLKRCHQVTAAIFLDRCREWSITPSQYGALSVLRLFPGIDQLAVGRLLGLDRSTAGLVIKLLAKRGLIERSVNTRDRRSMRLQLSDAGRSTLRKVARLAEAAQKEALAALPAAKRAQFLELLEAFLQGHRALIDPDDVVSRKTFGSLFDALAETRRRPGSKPPRKRRA